MNDMKINYTKVNMNDIEIKNRIIMKMKWPQIKNVITMIINWKESDIGIWITIHIENGNEIIKRKRKMNVNDIKIKMKQ